MAREGSVKIKEEEAKAEREINTLTADARRKDAAMEAKFRKEDANDLTIAQLESAYLVRHVHRPTQYFEIASADSNEGLAGKLAQLPIIGNLIDAAARINTAQMANSALSTADKRAIIWDGLNVGLALTPAAPEDLGAGGLTSLGAGSLDEGVQQVSIASADTVNAAMRANGQDPAWLSGTDVSTQVVPRGTRYNMVVEKEQARVLMAGKSRFGGWATPVKVPSQTYARQELEIRPEYKSDVFHAVTVETTGPQVVKAGLTTGKAKQVQFTGERRLRVVGKPRILPKG